ncbi:NADH:flavin oxidoreductase [Mycolicibacterium aurum]|uniref:NADH:flavin oxidoreductase n=1 Tax=Mycolicibacterium aurum TaxID=1791 RepID=A0A448IZA8_MYCAU|nr:alkene reductase [Mycolicibacterium aurum]VEG57779.1 NADH:flavin oxidoreductase [Mycolicibacterium aurum]
MTYTLAADSTLLKPTTLGGAALANRIFMAPLTRSRADADGTPSALAAQYYSQRATAGLIISEATAVCEQANGAYMNTPGIYTDRHQEQWAEIASAVHAAGGKMFVQLWHVGRMAHPDISGFEAVGPSAIAADLETHTPTGKQPLPVPRTLTVDEIASIVGQFRSAARRAVDAGMDGVEIHSANGYLLHEFLSDVVNVRTDSYGGSPQNRARLAAEVVEAVAAEIGPERVGLRISPGNSAGDMHEVDQISAYESLLCRISPLDIAYLHVVIAPSEPAFAAIRTVWEGTLVLNTPRTIDTDFELLENLAEWGVIGAAAVGRGFLANPDLITRLTLGADLNVPDQTTFYAPGPGGYIDYPTLEELASVPEPQSA